MERLLNKSVDIHSDIVSPRIYVISRPALTEEYRVFVLDQASRWQTDPKATDAELLIEFAGRICYKSFGSRQSPKSNSEYIRHLISQGHESVLEHATWSFVLSGISRAFTHQLVRHRVGFAFSQLSQQYHEEGDANFVQPAGLEKHPAALKAWKNATQNALAAYRTILRSLEKSSPSKIGIPPGKEILRATRSAARSVCIEGDQEMRSVSSLILDSIRDDAPAVFSDFEIGYLPDGSPIVLRVDKPSTK
jgi:thymidylate synthase (FAD)